MLSLGAAVVPESLLGHCVLGLLTLDDSNSISAFNRAAVSLVAIDVEMCLGLPLSAICPHVEALFATGFCTANTPQRTIDFKVVAGTISPRVISMTDASMRTSHESLARNFETTQSTGYSNWNEKLQAVGVMKVLHEYAEDPIDVEGLAQIAARTGKILFPQGGSVKIQSANSQQQNQTDWGGASDNETVSLAFESGELNLRGAFDTDLAKLFAKTIELGAYNLEIQ